MVDRSRDTYGSTLSSSDSESIDAEEHEALNVNEARDTEPLLAHEGENCHDNVNLGENPTTARARRRAQLFNMLSTVVVDVAMPVMFFYTFRNFVPDLYALLISGIPPLLSVIVKFAKRRRVDILGFIVVVGFVVSATISIVSGDASAVLLRESAITFTSSLLFLCSLLPIKNRWFKMRPLTFMMTQQMYADAPPVTWVDAAGEKHTMQLTDWMWDVVGGYARRYHYWLSAGWGFFLMLEVVIRVYMVLGTTLPVERIYLYGTVIAVGVVIFMLVCSFVGGVRLKRLCIAWMRQNDHSGITHEDV